MPGKEAVVEVETSGIILVTKEVPKGERACQEVEGKKEDVPKPVETAESVAVPDLVETKPQETEITSSAQEVVEKVKDSSNSSANGSAPKPEAGVPLPESKVEGVGENPKSSETSTKAAQPESGAVDGNAKSSEAVTTESNVEPVTDGAKGSEADAETFPADDEKIVIEMEKSKKLNSDVTGSDEVTRSTISPGGTENNKSEKDQQCADSSTEKEAAEDPSSSKVETDNQPGSSSTSEAQPDVEAQIEELRKQGLALYVRRDFCAAADSFGKVLELQAPLYGEMSDKLAETYFLYGSAMYEYGKTENTVLGEKVKEKDEEESDEEEEDEVDDKQMEVDDKEAEPASAESGEKNEPSGSSGIREPEDDAKEPADETLTGEDKDEDEDDAFRVAWEMLELAKATFLRANNKKRLADTLMKLGEVGIETGNSEAIAEMVEGLKVRKEIFPANHRIIPETHFNIGVAFAFFEKYDDAIEHFISAKTCLEKRIDELSKSENKEDKDEVEEMKIIVPEIQEKIDDTKESKADKEKLKETQAGTSKEATPFPTPVEAKPVSDITHLVKRKRKVDDILPERAAKQIRQDDGAAVASTTGEPEKTEGSMETAKADESKGIPESAVSKEAQLDATGKATEPTKETPAEPSNSVADSGKMEE